MNLKIILVGMMFSFLVVKVQADEPVPVPIEELMQLDYIQFSEKVDISKLSEEKQLAFLGLINEVSVRECDGVDHDDLEIPCSKSISFEDIKISYYDEVFKNFKIEYSHDCLTYILSN